MCGRAHSFVIVHSHIGYDALHAMRNKYRHRRELYMFQTAHLALFARTDGVGAAFSDAKIEIFNLHPITMQLDNFLENFNVFYVYACVCVYNASTSSRWGERRSEQLIRVHSDILVAR